MKRIIFLVGTIWGALLVMLALGLFIVPAYASNLLDNAPLIVVDEQFLAGALGVLSSLVFAYFPKIKEWFNAPQATPEKTQARQAQITALSLVIISLLVFFLGCEHVLNVTILCSQQGLIDLAKIVFAALATNQATFLLAVDPYQRKSA